MENVLKDKSYAFALRIVRLYQYLCDERREFIMSKQLLRSGTSIGANITEANQAQSLADFIHKLSIAHKESFETEFWIRLLTDSEYIEQRHSGSILAECRELQKILTKSIKTSKEKQWQSSQS